MVQDTLVFHNTAIQNPRGKNPFRNPSDGNYTYDDIYGGKEVRNPRLAVGYYKNKPKTALVEVTSYFRRRPKSGHTSQEKYYRRIPKAKSDIVYSGFPKYIGDDIAYQKTHGGGPTGRSVSYNRGKGKNFQPQKQIPNPTVAQNYRTVIYSSLALVVISIFGSWMNRGRR